MRLMLASVRSFNRHPECSSPCRAAANCSGVVSGLQSVRRHQLEMRPQMDQPGPSTG